MVRNTLHKISLNRLAYNDVGEASTQKVLNLNYSFTFLGSPLVEGSKRVHYNMVGVLFYSHNIELDHLLLCGRNKPIQSQTPHQKTRTSQVPHGLELQTC